MENAEVDLEVLDDRYELGSVIGRGGMALVRRGFDRRLGREVAIKLLAPELACDAEARGRFRQEARAAARVSHPAVVSVFDSGEDGARTYMVMECLPARTLADVLVDGPLPSARVRDLGIELLGGLAAAHASGVIHRDIKPSNVLFAVDGRAKLVDFGIAKAGDDVELTRTGLLLGTPAYLAPERLCGAAATQSSDIYSLGVVLYQALTGVRPFDGPDAIAIAQMATTTPPASIASRVPTVDPALAAVIERAISRDPADRYPSAAEMRRALQAASDRTVEVAVSSHVAPSAEPTTSIDRTAIFPGIPITPRRSLGPKRGLVALATLGACVAVVVLFLRTRAGDPLEPPVTTTVPPASVEAPETVPQPLEDALRQLEEAGR